MRVRNLKTDSGRDAVKQFIITDDYGTKYFQSCGSIIVMIKAGKVYLDKNYWLSSETTSKYRDQFLDLMGNASRKQTRTRVANSEYTLIDLNI